MDILSQITNVLNTITGFLVGLVSGGVLLYYLLPHIAKDIHANLTTLIWSTILLGVLMALAWPVLSLCIDVVRMTLAGFTYYWIPYEYAQSILDTFYTIFTLALIKMALFPKEHHSQLHS